MQRFFIRFFDDDQVVTVDAPHLCHAAVIAAIGPRRVKHVDGLIIRARTAGDIQRRELAHVG